MSQTPQPNPVAFVTSEFADDPDFAELLAEFVPEMSVRRDHLQKAYEAGEFAEVGRLAHQLKGAGSGYGFPELTEKAAIVEQAARSTDRSTLQFVLDDLVSYLERIR